MISLKLYNTYQVEAFARHCFFPKNIRALTTFLQVYPDIQVLGNGSNIILAENYYEKPFFFLRQNFAQISLDSSGFLYAQAGVILKDLSLMAYHLRLGGLSVFYDIPASVGGALWMNAGAYGAEIYDNVVYVDVCERQTGLHSRIYKSDISYGYRTTQFQTSSYVIVGAAFDLKVASQTSIRQEMIYYLAMRSLKLPRLPSGGSVFKRHMLAKIPTGQMIEQLGLKGLCVNDAQVSNQHAGVIVNKGKAQGADILNLIEYIQDSVFQAFDISLMLEQVII